MSKTSSIQSAICQIIQTNGLFDDKAINNLIMFKIAAKIIDKGTLAVRHNLTVQFYKPEMH